MSTLDDIAKQIEGQRQPPVELWTPDHRGSIDIEIDANGIWYHEGGQIHRAGLVQLFSSILWFEDGQHYLVTPTEKLAIQVQDVPFVIQSAEFIENHWVVTTNTQDRLIVGEQHPVMLRRYQGQDLPYVNVRYDLWARVSRAVYFQWVSEGLNSEGLNSEGLACEGLENDAGGPPTIYSGSYKIPLAVSE